MQQQQQQHPSNMNGPGLPPEKKQRVAGGYNPADTSTYDYQVSRHRFHSFIHVPICHSSEIPIHRINSNVFSLFVYCCTYFIYFPASPL